MEVMLMIRIIDFANVLVDTLPATTLQSWDWHRKTLDCAQMWLHYTRYCFKFVLCVCGFF